MLNGVLVSVEPFHVFRHVDEGSVPVQNRGPMREGERFTDRMRKIAGKRLTSAELTGKEAESGFAAGEHLSAKGFVEAAGRDHRVFFLYQDSKKTSIHTEVSHGQSEGLAAFAKRSRETL